VPDDLFQASAILIPMSARADLTRINLDVRFGSLADIQRRRPKSGHRN